MNDNIVNESVSELNSAVSKENDQNIFHNIIWYDLDEKGFLINALGVIKVTLNNAGVYIYQLQMDKSKFYIGSSINIWNRVVQHRNAVSQGINTCPKFYNCVKKHGWNNLKFGVLEHVNKSVITKSKKINNVLIKKEQFYLDNLFPTLNINTIAGSMLGYKHSEKIRQTMSAKRRGISRNKSKVKLCYNISDKTKDNLCLRARNGVKVKVYDSDNNLISIYPTLQLLVLLGITMLIIIQLVNV